MMLEKLTFATGDRIWFTADTHFGHAGEARRRGYSDVDEHDRDLIRNWNEYVKKNDIVFHLGDFTNSEKAPFQQEIFAKLNGRKYLVLGNHDNQATYDLGWAAPPQHRMIVQIGKEQYVLDHYAGRTWYSSFHGSYQLFGHSHGRMPATNRSCDVGLDTWNLCPASIYQIRALIDDTTLDLRAVQDQAPGPAM
ncbi:metallophosphoesterase [Devosia sp. SD17-2]|uniref:metallophosphoesterase n=1 Tax=Devosia sp. SD17-2 TaxID=2976459 RepID=UPI0023D7E8DB|nr:metallophosphoesterase [Devosia sp. SD17-2]WEJ35113.1 metallophosphoesterase [Devosia sp. SD17-2]